MTAFSLQGKIGLDARDFKKGAQEASDAIEGVGDELDDLPEKGRQAGDDAGASLGAGLVKGFAAAGAVAVIGKALNDAMNIEAGLDRVTAQFGLTADEAERYGKLGGDLYRDAWGESVTDATRSIALVGDRLQEVGDIADDELAGITESAMAVADVFSQDIDSVVRSVGQLLRNDLVDSAEEGLDLVTVAFQEGGDQAGDLLDTIDEYSQHFARMGVDGNEALGVIIEGFQQGFRDGDKLADLFKEFAIRALEDRAVAAFEAIGLAGTQTQDKIAEGGDAARDALGDVIRGLEDMEDPVERNRVAVELFGTQYEDLGPQVLGVLGTLEDGLGDVENAAADMAEAVKDNTEQSFEELKRRGETTLASFGEIGLELIDMWGKVWGDASTNQEVVDAALERTGRNVDDLKLNVDEGLGGAFNSYAREADIAKKTVTDGLGEIDEAADDTVDNIGEIEQAFADLRGEVSDRSAYYDVLDSFDDIEAAYARAMDTSDKSVGEQEADQRDLQRSIDATRLEVLDYDEEVGGLPDEKLTAILALIDRGKIAEAEWLLNDVARRRTAFVDVRVRGNFRAGALGTVNADAARAEGGPVTAGRGYVVGEEGPEFFVPNTSGMILPNTGSVASTSIANASHTTVNLSVQSLDADNAGRVIVDTLSRFYASGGQRP